MDKANIAIVGAGMGGLATALALQKIGLNVSVYEQAPELGEVGAGLSISPNAMHALDYLGVGARMREMGSVMSEGTTRHYKTNELLASQTITRSVDHEKRFGNEYYQIHRADLHLILSDAVRANDPDCIKLDHEVVGIEQDGSSVTAKFGNSAEVKADVLIGADGGKSRVRELVFSEEPPKFAGYVAYRGLVPVKDLDPSVVRPGAALSIGPGQMFMRYTVRHKELLNFVGIVKTSEWKEEGWNIPSDKSEVLNHFKDWHDEVKTIIQATPDGAGFKWALVHRSVLPSWVNGRVALLGDSAHTITPFLGQGAAMALEDGVVFARSFQAAGDIDQTLSLYDASRTERGNWVLLESQRQGHRMMGGDPKDFDQETTRNVYAQVFAYDPATVPLAQAS